MGNRDLVGIAIFSALFIASSLLPSLTLPYILVPITAQTLMVTLAGGILGAKRGAISIIVVLILAAIGLPVLAQGKGGLAAFFSPTTGYLLSFPFSAYFTGKILHYYKGQNVFVLYGLLFISAVLFVHFCGLLWVSFFLDLPLEKAFFGIFIFIPGDALKLALAIFIIQKLRLYYPNAFHS